MEAVIGPVVGLFVWKKVTVQQHHIFGRSTRLAYTRYAAPSRLSKSAVLLNGYRPAVIADLVTAPVNGYLMSVTDHRPQRERFIAEGGKGSQPSHKASHKANAQILRDESTAQAIFYHQTDEKGTDNVDRKGSIRKVPPRWA